MSEDFNTDEKLHFFFFFFAQPHLFEPEYTDEELRQMDEAAAARVSEYSHRAASRWCDGGKSKAVPTEDESLRCSQRNRLMPPLEPVWQLLGAREHGQVCRVAAALMSQAERACSSGSEQSM